MGVITHLAEGAEPARRRRRGAPLKRCAYGQHLIVELRRRLGGGLGARPRPAALGALARGPAPLSAGFGPELADVLAHQERVDPHELLKLVDRGCPPHLAARILAPLNAPLGLTPKGREGAGDW